MHLGLVLAGLAAIVAAAPTAKAGDTSMAGYEPYEGYNVYYETYTPYPAATEEEAAKVSMCDTIPALVHLTFIVDNDSDIA
jgi:hypothetical protein